jgi:two-component system, sensor histidine kinase and response regulator
MTVVNSWTATLRDLPALDLKSNNSPVMRILFADDQKDIRLLTKVQLEKAGHNVVAVANGEAALRSLREDAPFDLVLLDEEMPGMSGTEVLRAIRAAEKVSGHIVVIALTGYNTEEDEERLLNSGFDSVIGKPFRMETLGAVLRASAPKAQPSVPTVTPADPLTRLGGDEQLLQRVARTFLRGLQPRLAKIRRALQQKKGDDLASLAHALKGTLSIFGADKAAELCEELQEHAKSGHFAGAERTLAALRDAISQLEPDLRNYVGENQGARKHSKSNRRKPESKRKTP